VTRQSAGYCESASRGGEPGGRLRARNCVDAT
jgi:hypothetical protein